jgi:hypothetical protein
VILFSNKPIASSEVDLEPAFNTDSLAGQNFVNGTVRANCRPLVIVQITQTPDIGIGRVLRNLGNRIPKIVVALAEQVMRIKLRILIEHTHSISDLNSHGQNEVMIAFPALLRKSSKRIQALTTVEVFATA